MTLPKKTSRPIVVGDEPYRWMVKPTSNHLVLTVQHESGGQLLQSTLNKLNLCRKSESAQWVFDTQGRSVTPSVVRTIIETAVADGWDPTLSKSSPFILDLLVWRMKNRTDEVKTAKIDRVLDPPIREWAAENSLHPVPQLAQDACEWMIHDLAWPTQFRNDVMNLDPGESLPIPENWIPRDAQELGFSFTASFHSLEKNGVANLVIKADQYDGEAVLQLLWY